ncbi:hypothetical protein B0J17DRAFT_722311 [Rhizoctonia solani]|nr:hypothetical protein B0J17DRAFT_722311 [Rhizoctonia solani]
MHGIDDDEGDDAFQLFRALIGGDQLAHSLILSEDPAELGDEWSNLDLPQTILSATSYDTCVEIIEPFLESSRVDAPLLFQLEISDGKSLGHTTAGLLFSDRLKDARRLLECAQGHIYGTPVSPPAPLSPKSPTLRRRPTSVALTSELNEARRQVSDLQHTCATLERNSLEQISQLDESNQELQSGKDSLQAELNILKDMLDDIRKKNAQEQVKTQERHTQTEPLPEAKPTREELQNEVLELKRQLDKTKLHEANTAKQVASLSKELATMKSSLADTQKANTELKKKVGTLEKQADTSAKAAETKKEEADKAKAETTKTNLQLKSAKEDLEKAQRQLKEYGSSRTKIEEERTKAISVAEGLLKIKDGVEKQLAEAKSRVDTIKQQASTKVGLLKESLLEKESQLREIARAAETWALASAEAKSLKDELKLLRDCTDAREREAHGEHQRLQVEFRRANEEWQVEQTRLQTTISSLSHSNEEVRDRLEAMTKDKDDEANGYMKRIAELEEWCEHRWDAVGNNCVIA